VFASGVSKRRVLEQAHRVLPDDETAVIVKTRFSLRWRGALPTFEWLRKRLDLLKAATLPSLKAQTMPHFDWAILTDPDLANVVSDLFRDLDLPGRPAIVPVAPTAPTMREDVTESLRRDRKRFLVVRLDSDDALAPTALEHIVAAAATCGDGESLINLPSGILLDWTTGKAWKRRFRDRYQGPFYALLHANRDCVLFSGGDHRTARAHRRVEIVPGTSWLQTVHSDNIDNRISGRTLNERIKAFLRRTADSLSPADIAIDDLEPLDAETAATWLGRFGVNRQSPSRGTAESQ